MQLRAHESKPWHLGRVWWVFVSFRLCQKKQNWLRWCNSIPTTFYSCCHTTIPWSECCSDETRLPINNSPLLILLPLFILWGKENEKKEHGTKLPQRAEVSLWSWGLISNNISSSYHQQLTVTISAKTASGIEVIVWSIIE